MLSDSSRVQIHYWWTYSTRFTKVILIRVSRLACGAFASQCLISLMGAVLMGAVFCSRTSYDVMIYKSAPNHRHHRLATFRAERRVCFARIRMLGALVFQGNSRINYVTALYHLTCQTTWCVCNDDTHVRFYLWNSVNSLLERFCLNRGIRQIFTSYWSHDHILKAHWERNQFIWRQQAITKYWEQEKAAAFYGPTVTSRNVDQLIKNYVLTASILRRLQLYFDRILDQ